MRSEEEIKEAIQDYSKLTAQEYATKYHLGEMARENVGFVRALRWVLKLI